MSFFSSIKNVAKTAVRTTAKVVQAPTKIATKVVSKVAPKPISSIFGKVANLTPTSLVTRAALNLSKAPAPARAAVIAAPTRGAPAAAYGFSTVGASAADGRSQPRPQRPQRGAGGTRGASAGGRGRGRGPRGRDGKPPGLLSRIGNAITLPTASPATGQMISPAVVAAAAAATQASPSPGFSTSWGGGGGGGDGGGGDSYDSGADDAYSESGAEDPAAELPEGYLDDRDDGGEAEYGMTGLDYHAALGDVSSELKAFALTAGKTVASQALTTIGKKLTGGAMAPPPPPPGMSTMAKIAIGAAVALPVGYILLRRRPAVTTA